MNNSTSTGSFRYGDKTEGRSVFVQEYFRPDESHLGARRGAVGMRRIKKTSENKGLVGSQFRIILNHQKQFTGKRRDPPYHCEPTNVTNLLWTWWTFDSILLQILMQDHRDLASRTKKAILSPIDDVLGVLVFSSQHYHSMILTWSRIHQRDSWFLFNLI